MTWRDAFRFRMTLVRLLVAMVLGPVMVVVTWFGLLMAVSIVQHDRAARAFQAACHGHLTAADMFELLDMADGR